MTDREQADALVLLKRTLTYLPDGSALESEIRVFLMHHDPVWSQAYEEGLHQPEIRRLPR